MALLSSKVFTLRIIMASRLVILVSKPPSKYLAALKSFSRTFFLRAFDPAMTPLRPLLYSPTKRQNLANHFCEEPTHYIIIGLLMLKWQLAHQVHAPEGISAGKRILIKGLSGALGAGIGALILYPLENIKIRQMVDDSNEDEESRGIVSTTIKILREEGLEGLYVGVLPYTVYSVVNWGCFFLFYEYINTRFHLSHDQAWLTSIIAGVGCATAVSPLSMVSNYIVSQKKKAKRDLGYIAAFQEIYQQSGLRGFFNGYLFSLALVLNPTINMQFFEKLKILLPKYMPKDLAIFLAGALSKLAATIITYPMQTLKTIMQAAVAGRSVRDELIFLLREFGPFGLFKGLSAKISHSVLNSALMLFLTEKINNAVVNAVSNI